MRREELRAKFSQTVGLDKAEDIVAEAEAALGLEEAETYSTDEVRELCEEIQQEYGGYVSDVANEIRVHEQAEQRFRALLENIPDPAVVVEFDGDNPVVKTVNQAFDRTFGFDVEAAAGRSLDELIVPDDASTVDDAWVRRDADGETEVRRLTADGEERTFLFRAALAHRAGGAVEGYGVYTDITERERRERKVEHQNEQLERFVSVVSHDLRNPLNVATGRLSLAMDLVDDEEAVTQLESVADAHDQMEALIEDLLSLARQGRTVGETEAVDPRSVCQDAWASVETGDATFECEYANGPIAADPSRLTELLQNLFRNAVEHGGEDVTVRIGTLQGSERGFYVEDDGPGIPASEREDVFEYGFSTADGGTGFGLAIVQSISEAHGWSVTLTESERGGARFEFTDVRPA